MTTLADLPTPSLILERPKLLNNIERLASRLRGRGVVLRPHLKTAKSVDVARLAVRGAGPATVSTLKEAQVFGRAGITDLLYAVQLSPQKLADVTRLRREGIDLKVVVDSKAAADAVSDHALATGDRIPCLIEIDVDGHRAGLAPEDTKAIVEVGRAIARGARLMGVMTHAGESYALSAPDALARAAENERAGAVRAAEALRGAGLECTVVSIGSSPTAHALENFDGVTEIRAGVYMFGDLVQAGIGVCAIEDIAVSVLATVIGHQPEKGWVLVDCGWTAMSSDRGTSEQAVDYALGLVIDADGKPFGDIVLLRAFQEHGILAVRPGSGGVLPDLPVGARVRILPNHACATGTQHERYHVVEDGRVIAAWPRFNGWELDAGPAPNLAIVGRDAVRATATRAQAFEAIESAFRAMSNGGATLFPVVNAVVEAPNTAFTIKSGVNHEQGIVGVKIGSYWPKNMERFGVANHNSTTLLLDNDTGAPRAIVNARELNGLRTAAANAVATNALARQDAEVLLMIGAGHQARFEARAIADVRRIKRVLIWSRTRAQAESMAADLSDLQAEIVVVDDANAAAREADIITTVTTSRAALLAAASVRPGVHISAMGADMDGKQELDPAGLKNALLFADWPAQSAAIGEFQHVCKAGLRSASEIIAIGDVLTGRHPGRTKRDDITVFDSSGVSIQDLNAAQAVLDAVLASGAGEAVRF